jgi:outer membrane phospholipase A
MYDFTKQHPQEAQQRLEEYQKSQNHLRRVVNMKVMSTIDRYGPFPQHYYYHHEKYRKKNFFFLLTTHLQIRKRRRFSETQTSDRHRRQGENPRYHCQIG